MRRAVALLLLAGALVAPASSAAATFPDAEFENQCQYSYDRYWRPVPMIFGGRLTNGSGTELAPGAQLTVGDTVRLEGGTVTAILPSWITTFAYESGMIPAGDGEIPVKAYLALEATNTAEGVRAPIELTTYARTHVVLTSSGIVDEGASTVLVDKAPIPAQSWTATGGDVQVRQALAESMPPLPIGRNGALVNVRGSLYVDAALTFPSGEMFHLYLDCLQGQQVDQGATHTDVIPGPFAAPLPVPGFEGTVGETPLAGPVDAELRYAGPLSRVAAGAEAKLEGGTLRVRLTDAQREAWLGDATSVPITAAIDLVGARSTPGTRVASVQQTVTVPADGAATLDLPLSTSAWTAAGAGGVDLRGERVIVLEATVDGVPRRLTLTRISATDPYPFARFLRPGPPPTPIPDPDPDPDPGTDPDPDPDPDPGNPGGGGGGGGDGQQPPVVVPAAQPTATPEPAKTPGAAKVTAQALKVKANRVGTVVSCAGETACTGTVSLRSSVKVKKQYVTLTKSVKYTIAPGGKATIRLSLSSAGKRYVRGKRRVSVTLNVKPSTGKTVTKKLTLTR